MWPIKKYKTNCFISQDNKMFYLYFAYTYKEKVIALYRRIRDLREDRDLLQKDIAQYLKCTQVSYSHYELGKRDIPTDVLIRLAAFYGTSVDYLLGITDEKIPYPKAK